MIVRHEPLEALVRAMCAAAGCRPEEASRVARRLVEESEALAAKWGCRAVGLHCNAKNDAAWKLYRSLGYRRTVLEPVWAPYGLVGGATVGWSLSC